MDIPEPLQVAIDAMKHLLLEANAHPRRTLGNAGAVFEADAALQKIDEYLAACEQTSAQAGALGGGISL